MVRAKASRDGLKIESLDLKYVDISSLEEICAYVNQGVGGCRVSEKKKKVQVSYEERGVFEHAHVERPNRTAGRERRLNSGRDTGTNEKITNRDNGQKEGRLISAWTQRIVADLEKSLQRLSGSPMPPEVLPGVLKLNALREERHLQQSRRHRPQS